MMDTGFELIKDFIADEFVINFSSQVKFGENNLDYFSKEVYELIDTAKEKNCSQIVIIDQEITNKTKQKKEISKEIFVVKDHINLTTHNPLLGPNDKSKGQRFFAVNDLFVIPEELSSISKSVAVGINKDSLPSKEEISVLVSQNQTKHCFTYNFVQTSLIAAHRNLKVCGLVFC